MSIIQSIYFRLVVVLGITMSPFTITPALADPAPRIGDTFWGSPCSTLGRGTEYGPYDYTARHSYMDNLKLVEDFHFTPNVEKLIAGQNSVDPIGDIDYTLRAWPNHHRALNSAIRLRVNKEASYYLTANFPPAECYLQRAINYSPKDATARMLFGILLHRMHKYEEAMKQYEEAKRLEPSNIQIKYNMALLLIDMGRSDEAAVYAKEIYRNNFPLPGLKRRLLEAGYLK